jgi:polyether ionophore transport system permease protein
VLSGRREFGAGLIRRHDSRNTRLRLRTPVGLAARLARTSLLAWTVAVAAIGTLFSTMGSGAVRQSRDGDLGGFLGAQLGASDPAAGYLAYCGTVVGIVVSTFAALSMMTSKHAESTGLTDLVLTTGVRRWTPLAAQAAVTAVGCAIILTATGVLSALIAPAVIDGKNVAARSLVYALGQWPAAVAMTGCTALLIGLRPRLAGLAWLPLVASGGLALLGALLRIPQRIRDLGFFQHVPDIAAPDPHIGGLLLLFALGTGLCLLGIAGTTRREVTTG